MTDRDKILAKIKKCLRLSRSSNEHEAAAALRQAQALMAKHSIDLEDVEQSEVREVGTPAGSASPAAWEFGLANMVKSCFACDVLIVQAMDRNVWKVRAEWRFVGRASNPEIAAYAFAVLRRQILLARSQYILIALRRCKLASKRRRADAFCRGWVLAAQNKVVAIWPTEDDARAIAGFIEAKHPSATSSTGRTRGHRSLRDLESGYREGEKAQLHQGVGHEQFARLTDGVRS